MDRDERDRLLAELGHGDEEIRRLAVERLSLLAAADAVRTANQFNPPVPAGREYVLVRVGAKSAHTDQASHRIYN